MVILKHSNSNRANLFRGKILFENGNYSEAMPFFKIMVATSPRNISANYYLGLCHYNLSLIAYDKSNTFSFEKAKVHFLAVINKNSKKFGAMASFYLANCHLLNGEFQEAANLFKKASSFGKGIQGNILDFMEGVSYFALCEFTHAFDCFKASSNSDSETAFKLLSLFAVIEYRKNNFLASFSLSKILLELDSTNIVGGIIFSVSLKNIIESIFLSQIARDFPKFFFTCLSSIF